MLNWTKQQAKDYMVNYHFINSSPASSIEEVFERIKTIQFDPLNVVGMNSELVLQARIPNFKRSDLYEALYEERYLIDGWDKVMSIYHINDFKYFHPTSEYRSNSSMEGYLKHLHIDLHEYTDQVLEIIKEKGPILAKDISLGKTKKHKWGTTKPSTAAIDYLFHRGIIGVHSRKNTQKKYDLIERLIPNYDETFPFNSEEEYLDYLLERRIKSIGIIWNKNGDAFR